MEELLQQFGIKFNAHLTFYGFGLIFTRVFMMFFLNPFLTAKPVPGRVRLLISLLFSLFLYPYLIPPLEATFPKDSMILFLLFLKEFLFGFTISLITSFTFHALESAGRVVDQQRGEANAQVFLPQLGQVSLFGLFNFWLSISLFLSTGMHRFFLKAFFLSFETVPLLHIPTMGPGITPFLDFVVHLSGHVLIIAVQLAAPVLIAILLIDLVLGISNKMAPQMNVFELGFAIKGYMGPLVVYVSLLIVVSEMENILNTMIVWVNKAAHLFAS